MADHADPENPQGLTDGAQATLGPAPVFISYASADVAVADRLVATLESHGVACWIAPRDVKAGALYAEAIVRAISDAKALVLVLSANSVASAHVGKEVERASSKRRPVIALRIEEAPLSPALEYFLSESHWVDARTGGMDGALAKLIAATRDPQRRAPGTLAGTVSAPQPRARRFRIPLPAGIAVVAAALAALLVDRFWLAKHSIPEQAAVPAPSGPVAAKAVDTPISEKSIAVLPFADMSEKKDQEYFADGIAEEVLDRLAKVPGLKVLGRASSFRFKGKDTDPAGIGAALGVSYLLEGSVRRDGERVRVTAQLIDTPTGSQRWSDHFDSGVVDVLHVQDTIAVELARALQIAVEVDTTPRSSIKSPDALDAYLHGLQSLNRGSREDSQAAVADFQRALSLDPAFAPAAIGVAQTYAYIGTFGWLPTRVAFERARQAALLAQRLDPKSPTPHVTLGEVHLIYD
jgi:TolB-like protein